MTADNDDRKVIIIEREAGGIGWAVAFIVLAIAIGFGVLVFMDQQSMIEYKIERALQEMKDRDPDSFNEISRTAHARRSQLGVESSHVPQGEYSFDGERNATNVILLFVSLG
ncbi:MAG: hypothetical protein K2X93_09610, partial [Candidatus Obscuribacterales bacterium]|nr:hypothetical protein [Candidatus Obscuribacterales bacterium]